MSKHYYLTTPIYYVNDKAHLGTAYATITADVLARYHRLFGDDVLFLTGTDEHGQKIEQAAKKRGMSPQEHCDDMVQNFISAWRELGISYDIFYRTTDEFHKKAVQNALQKIYDQGDIYTNTYEGWYSVSEEIFYTEKDLVDGKSPGGREVTLVKETNYFFKMSKYQQKLIDYIEAHPDFIQPTAKKNEVLGFLRQPLQDLCISRPKERLQWGIEIPFDKDYVTYVWFDALLNYAVAVGLNREGMENNFKTWWSEGGAHHLIGKDILTTHAVYWTTMLFALGLPLPKQIFAHGWILNKDMGKMSKSVGDVLSPSDLVDKLGLDGLRYVLSRDVHLGNDAPFSLELAMQRVNSDLANNIGNLLSRSTNLIEKFFDGQKPEIIPFSQAFEDLKTNGETLASKVEELVRSMKPSLALEQIFLYLTETNKFLEDNAPWKMVKEDKVKAGSVLSAAVEALRIASILLHPVMPESTKNLLSQIGVNTIDFKSSKKWDQIPVGTQIAKANPLFPRLEIKEKA